MQPSDLPIYALIICPFLMLPICLRLFPLALGLPAILKWSSLQMLLSACHRAWFMQNQDLAHKLWVIGHRVLFNLHMLRAVLHKAAPKVFAGPHLVQLVIGASPYKAFTSAMYQDGILFAGTLTAIAALLLLVIQT